MLSLLHLHGVLRGRQPFILSIFIPSQFVYMQKYVINLKLSIKQYVKRKSTLKIIIVLSKPQTLIWKSKCNVAFKKKHALWIMQHETAAFITLTIQKE